MNFHDLESALSARNPLLTQRLRPPLSVPGIQAMLTNAGLGGNLQPVIALYSWHNGTTLDQTLMNSNSGFFPGEIYQMSSLDKALLHLEGHKETIFHSS